MQTLEEIVKTTAFPFNAVCSDEEWMERCYPDREFFTFTHKTDEGFYFTPPSPNNSEDPTTYIALDCNLQWAIVKPIAGTLLEIKNSGVSFPFTVRSPSFKQKYEIINYDENTGKFEVYNVGKRKVTSWDRNARNNLELIPGEYLAENRKE